MGISTWKIPTLKDRGDSRPLARGPAAEDIRSIGLDSSVVAEETFIRILRLERKRTERSRNPFLLMLLNAQPVLQNGQREKVFRKIVSALSTATRETDTAGWYRKNSVIGVIFTEIGMADKTSIVNTILARVSTALRTNLDLEQTKQIELTFHFFPEDWGQPNMGAPPNVTLYPDLSEQNGAKRFSPMIKRTMDIVGSVLALIIFSPLFIVVSVAIKLSSKGPVLFRQERVGRYGTRFTFLKFRSMYLANDPSIHKDFVARLISGNVNREQPGGNQRGVYKIKDDPRVTPVGKFLRKTSLDEFPQFWNVLKGEMSLVGPRPPIPYELDAYDIWHRRRVLEVKPGITGLWQVKGRSRLQFDDMVRLDLRYAKTWSPWLDLKILLRTPFAVFTGEGAY
ncbi:MAG: sugar transferase [Acidobacteriota bacterium]